MKNVLRFPGNTRNAHEELLCVAPRRKLNRCVLCLTGPPQFLPKLMPCKHHATLISKRLEEQINIFFEKYFHELPTCVSGGSITNSSHQIFIRFLESGLGSIMNSWRFHLTNTNQIALLYLPRSFSLVLFDNLVVVFGIWVSVLVENIIGRF